MAPARSTRNRKKTTKARTPGSDGSMEDDIVDPDLPNSNTRFTPSFPMLRDLVFLACEREPWRAEQGKGAAAWEAIAQTLNERFNLSAPKNFKESTARTRVYSLKKLQETGKRTRTKLSDEQHITLAAALDTLSHKIQLWEEQKAETSLTKKQLIEDQANRGELVRNQAITRLSQRKAQSTSNNAPATSATTQTTATHRASSMPLSGGPVSIPNLVTALTSAINESEGRHAQRSEVLQSEVVRATRETAAAAKRSAAAIERLADAVEGLCARLDGQGPGFLHSAQAETGS